MRSLLYMAALIEDTDAEEPVVAVHILTFVR